MNTYFTTGFEKKAWGRKDKNLKDHKLYGMTLSDNPITIGKSGLALHGLLGRDKPMHLWAHSGSVAEVAPGKNQKLVALDPFGNPVYEEKGHIYIGDHESPEPFHDKNKHHFGTVIGTKTKGKGRPIIYGD